jgi:hypothetical protein
LSVEEALLDTAKFWSTVPFTPFYLDNSDPSSWPDPWTLIYENYFCDVAKCLGIVYTVALTEHIKDLEVEIRVYKDSTTNHEYNLAWFAGGKYILNLIDNEIVNKEHIDKNLKLIRVYSDTDLHLKEYNN